MSKLARVTKEIHKLRSEGKNPTALRMSRSYATSLKEEIMPQIDRYFVNGRMEIDGVPWVIDGTHIGFIVDIGKLTNLDKMNQLVGQNATKQDVNNWAYMNRIWLVNLCDEEEFASMESSVKHFIDNNEYSGDEHENWDRFLGAEYVEEKVTV